MATIRDNGIPKVSRRVVRFVGHLLIAATALAWDVAVLTENAREFERIPALEVRKPEWPE